MLETCRVYLIQQFCLLPEHQNRDLAEETLQQDWLKPMDEILSVLKVSSTWDSAKLSECLKLLFREILLPTYTVKEGADKFLEFFKSKIYPEMEQVDLSKRGLAAKLEHLIFVHAYVHTLFETCPQEEFERTI